MGVTTQDVGAVVFYHTNAAAESKPARKMLCFTLETAGAKVEGVGRAGAGHVRSCSHVFARVRTCSRVFRAKCNERVANRIVTVV